MVSCLDEPNARKISRCEMIDHSLGTEADNYRGNFDRSGVAVVEARRRRIEPKPLSDGNGQCSYTTTFPH